MFRVSVQGGEPESVAKLPLDVDALEAAPGGRHLVFAMAVFPGKSPSETAAELDVQSKRKASGRLYQQLFVRHWDAWENGTICGPTRRRRGTGRRTTSAGRSTAASCTRPPIIYGRDSLVGPTELYAVHRLARMAPARITHLNDGKVAAARFGKPEQFTFTGSQGATVYGWVSHPRRLGRRALRGPKDYRVVYTQGLATFTALPRRGIRRSCSSFRTRTTGC